MLNSVSKDKLRKYLKHYFLVLLISSLLVGKEASEVPSCYKVYEDSLPSFYS